MNQRLSHDSVRLIFWGTPVFALPSLSALHAQQYQVVGVITNPNEPVGREQVLTPPPVKILAAEYRIPVLQPANLKDENFKKGLPTADLFVIAAYGKMIPKEILDLPKFGVLNVHPSLLPRWRGPSPIQYTILEGDPEAGVTIMQVDNLMDHGPLLANRKSQIANRKITYGELHNILANQGAELLIEIIPKYVRGEITPIPQNDAEATYSKILKKDDGRINWAKPAEVIERMVRALNPWPGTWTLWPADNKIFRIRIEEAEATSLESPVGSEGYVWTSPSHPLLVKTRTGSLAIKALTLSGKKLLDAATFLNGYPHIVGTNLI